MVSSITITTALKTVGLPDAVRFLAEELQSRVGLALVA